MRLVTSIFILGCFAIALSGAAVGQDGARATYEVYALRYAVYRNFPVASLVSGAEKGRKIDLAMTVWLLKGSNGRNVLVDTGCYHEKLVKVNGLTDFIKPSDAVSKLNIKPDQIT